MKTLLEMPVKPQPGLAKGAIVLRDMGHGEFVTHWRNDETGGYSSGHYFDNLPDAAADWATRAKRAC